MCHLPLIEFPYNNSYQVSIQMAPFEVLNGRKCRSAVGWFEAGEAKVIGLDLVQDALEKVKVIRNRLVVVQSRQKAYANKRCKDLKFLKGHMRFRVRKKLSPRYNGPYEIVERVGNMAYRLALPSDLEGVHLVFHVSML